MAGGLFGGGDGSVLNPYIVEDELDLNAVRNHASSNFIQAQDIDLSIGEFAGKNWVPIGGYFAAKYDGDNKKILNLKGKALFGRLGETAQFHNIIIENAVIDAGGTRVSILCEWALEDSVLFYNCHVNGVISAGGSISTGGICGTGGYSTIQYCSASGEINVSTNKVGGIVGEGGMASILGCVSTMNISASKSVGGIAGEDTAPSGTVVDCVNKGNIHSIISGTAQIGGIVGIFSRGALSNCHNEGDITAPTGDYVGGIVGRSEAGTLSLLSSTGDIIGVNYVGGCTGYWNPSREVSMSNTFALGSISGAQYVGGVVGRASANMSLTISDCYSKCNVSGNADSVGAFIGSISSSYSTPKLINCYATGLVTDISVGVGGGFYGILSGSSAKFTDCYFDTQTTGKNGPLATGLVGKTTAEMTNAVTFSAYDFANIWAMDGYPVLINNSEPIEYGIEGTVKINGVPVQGASVYCILPSYSIRKVKTNEDGVYTFRRLVSTKTFTLYAEYNVGESWFRCKSLAGVVPVLLQ